MQKLFSLQLVSICQAVYSVAWSELLLVDALSWWVHVHSLLSLSWLALDHICRILDILLWSLVVVMHESILGFVDDSVFNVLIVHLSLSFFQHLLLLISFVEDIDDQNLDSSYDEKSNCDRDGNIAHKPVSTGLLGWPDHVV